MHVYTVITAAAACTYVTALLVPYSPPCVCLRPACLSHLLKNPLLQGLGIIQPTSPPAHNSKSSREQQHNSGIMSMLDMVQTAVEQ